MDEPLRLTSAPGKFVEHRGRLTRGASSITGGGEGGNNASRGRSSRDVRIKMPRKSMENSPFTFREGRHVRQTRRRRLPKITTDAHEGTDWAPPVAKTGFFIPRKASPAAETLHLHVIMNSPQIVARCRKHSRACAA